MPILLVYLSSPVKPLLASGLEGTGLQLAELKELTNSAKVRATRWDFTWTTASIPVQIVRFGLFEADLQTGELRKNGARIPLQGQPFQVCAILLSRAGELDQRNGVGIGLSADGRSILYDGKGESESTIMLVKNFR